MTISLSLSLCVSTVTEISGSMRCWKDAEMGGTTNLAAPVTGRRCPMSEADACKPKVDKAWWPRDGRRTREDKKRRFDAPIFAVFPGSWNSRCCTMVGKTIVVMKAAIPRDERKKGLRNETASYYHSPCCHDVNASCCGTAQHLCNKWELLRSGWRTRGSRLQSDGRNSLYATGRKL
ncbi:hypothetical protein [uncultured Marivita sp.]|uniref:hypothetical protein n=1 Tax=uncultured Marivita sp. TaxID=888080 RepID=UPI00262413F9|nr:hypothetical protein [uncultured Marivita sp.]